MSLAAAIIAATGVVIALIAEIQYMPVSVLTLRPDKLGDYMNSPLAIVFNLSLLAAGACFFLATLAIYFTFPDPLSRAIAVVGGIVGMSIALMGIFPINMLEWHRQVSTIYLLSSLLLHALCFADYFKPKSTMTKRVLSLSILSIFMSVALISMLDWNVLDFVACDDPDEHFCLVAVCMWMLTQTNILWCVCLGLGMRKYIIAQQSFRQHALV
ncbi:hypothetical protein [Shewanella gaetbuli]|uniref:DUF998 domain-containing protein n=1 Tax=Shewanella gaetbuli TaxID=220752 RepID=A0A9X1ZXR2_9GAMM|nr:hypothetical protein [Shewanella gaetbuli]MCL1144096.1 hypothetical protein [Shewanella gaetbuli]